MSVGENQGKYPTVVHFYEELRHKNGHIIVFLYYIMMFCEKMQASMPEGYNLVTFSILTSEKGIFI